MLSGRKFRLHVQTAAIGTVDGKRVVTTIPAGEIVLVLSGPRIDDRRMVDVSWKERTLVVFYDDIEQHGKEVKTAAP